MRKERLRHRHKHLAPVAQQLEDAFGLFAAADGERQVHTAHRLKTLRRHIAAHQLRLADRHIRVENIFLRTGRNILWIRLIGVPHHHFNLSAKILLVEAKLLFTIPAKVQVRVQLHRDLPPRVDSSLVHRIKLAETTGNYYSSIMSQDLTSQELWTAVDRYLVECHIPGDPL